MDFLTSYRNPLVEVHIMRDLNPSSLNLLLRKKTEDQVPNNKLENIYINMGYNEVHEISEVGDFTDTMRDNIRLLRLWAPQANYHFFRVSADRNWAAPEIIRDYNKILTSQATTPKVKSIRPDDTWQFLTEPETNTLRPKNLEAARLFLFDAVQAKPISSIKKKILPSKNLLRPRGTEPDPLN